MNVRPPLSIQNGNARTAPATEEASSHQTDVTHAGNVSPLADCEKLHARKNRKIHTTYKSIHFTCAASGNIAFCLKFDKYCFLCLVTLTFELFTPK